MPTAQESYDARYEAPGRNLTKANRSATKRVRRLVAEVAEDTQKLPAAALRRLRPVFDRAQKELEGELTKWLKDAPSAGDRFTAHRMRTMLAQIRSAREAINREIAPELLGTLNDGYSDTAELSRDNLMREVSRLSQAFDSGTTGMMRLDIPTVSHLTDKNQWLLKRYPKLVDRYGARSWRNIRNKLAVGVAKNESYGEMARRIVGYMPSGASSRDSIRQVNAWVRSKPGTPPPNDMAADMAGGLLRGPYAEAERIVRTEMAHAMGSHQMESYAEMAANLDEEEPPLLKRWDASKDRRCKLCHALDGETVPWNQPFSSGDMHEPRHPNCRCTTVPWMSDWPTIEPLPALDDGTALRRRPPSKPVVTRGGTAIESERKLRRKARNLVKRSALSTEESKRHGPPVKVAKEVKARRGEKIPPRPATKKPGIVVEEHRPRPADKLNMLASRVSNKKRAVHQAKAKVSEAKAKLDAATAKRKKLTEPKKTKTVPDVVKPSSTVNPAWNKGERTVFNWSEDAEENDEMTWELNDKLKKMGLTTNDIKTTFEPPPGYKLEIGDADVFANNSRFYMQGEVYADNGDYVGEIERYIDKHPYEKKPMSVKHEAFMLHDDYQGTGVGSSMIETMFRNYERLGVEQVKVDTAAVGKYYWSKLGFRMDQASHSRFADYIQESIDKKKQEKKQGSGARGRSPFHRSRRYRKPDLSGVPDKEKRAMLKIAKKDPTLFARMRGTKVKFRFQGEDMSEPWNKAAMLTGPGWSGEIEVGTKRWHEARRLQKKNRKVKYD